MVPVISFGTITFTPDSHWFDELLSEQLAGQMIQLQTMSYGGDL